MSLMYRSERIPLEENSSLPVKLAWLKAFGPRKKRAVISDLQIRITGTYTQDANTSIAAGGFANVLNSIRVSDAESDLWKLPGWATRAHHIYENGRFAMPDPVAFVAGADGVRTVDYWLDFAPKQNARRRWDYALPADVLHDEGAIELERGDDGSLGTGGGSVLTGCYAQIFVFGREETDIEEHCRREVRAQIQQASEIWYLPSSGGLIRNAWVGKYADHVTGMGTIAGLDRVNITSMGRNNMPAEQYVLGRIRELNADKASTTDPFVQSTIRGLPLYWSPNGGKWGDYYSHPQSMEIEAEDVTEANLVIVRELITKKTEASVRSTLAIASKLGLSGANAVPSVKTVKGTMRSPKAWGAIQEHVSTKYKMAAAAK